MSGFKKSFILFLCFIIIFMVSVPEPVQAAPVAIALTAEAAVVVAAMLVTTGFQFSSTAGAESAVNDYWDGITDTVRGKILYYATVGYFVTVPSIWNTMIDYKNRFMNATNHSATMDFSAITDPYYFVMMNNNGGILARGKDSPFDNLSSSSFYQGNVRIYDYASGGFSYYSSMNFYNISSFLGNVLYTNHNIYVDDVLVYPAGWCTTDIAYPYPGRVGVDPNYPSDAETRFKDRMVGWPPGGLTAPGDFVGKTAEDWTYDDVLPGDVETDVPDVIPVPETELGSLQGIFSGVQNLAQLLQRILDGIIALPVTLANMLKALFIPADGFLVSEFNAIRGDFNGKFPNANLEPLDDLNITEKKLDDIWIDIMGVRAKIVDMSWANNMKGTINYWVGGFMYLLLSIYNYNKIYFLIRGTYPIKNYGPASVSSGGES